MRTVPNVIRHYGKAKEAYLNGERIERQDRIFVRSYRQWFETIDTFNHFVYYTTKNLGSTMMCTCGGPAGIFKFEAYKQFTSIDKGQIIACVNYVNSGRHADGSV